MAETAATLSGKRGLFRKAKITAIVEACAASNTASLAAHNFAIKAGAAQSVAYAGATHAEAIRADADAAASADNAENLFVHTRDGGNAAVGAAAAYTVAAFNHFVEAPPSIVLASVTAAGSQFRVTANPQSEEYKPWRSPLCFAGPMRACLLRPSNTPNCSAAGARLHRIR